MMKAAPLSREVCKAVRSTLLCTEVILHSRQSQSHFLTLGPLCCLFWWNHQLCWKLMIWESFFSQRSCTALLLKEDRLTRKSLSIVTQAHESFSPESHSRTGSACKGIYCSLPVFLWRVMSCPLESLILRHLYQVCKTKQVSISAVQAVLSCHIQFLYCLSRSLPF